MDVTSIRFSPDYPADKTIVAIASDEYNSYLCTLHKVDDVWEEVISPVEICESSGGSPAEDQIIISDLAFPSDYSGKEADKRVVFRYSTLTGDITCEANPNGSLHNIAGIINKGGNVLGMMPHPERACETILGSSDGNPIWESIIASI